MSPESNPAIELFELENLRKDRDFLLGEQKRLRSEVERLDRELSAEKQERVKEQDRVERLRGALERLAREADTASGVLSETKFSGRGIILAIAAQEARTALQPEANA